MLRWYSSDLQLPYWGRRSLNSTYRFAMIFVFSLCDTVSHTLLPNVVVGCLGVSSSSDSSLTDMFSPESDGSLSLSLLMKGCIWECFGALGDLVLFWAPNLSFDRDWCSGVWGHSTPCWISCVPWDPDMGFSICYMCSNSLSNCCNVIAGVWSYGGCIDVEGVGLNGLSSWCCLSLSLSLLIQ